MSTRQHRKLPESPNVIFHHSTAALMESTPISESFRRKPFHVGNRNLIKEESELQERGQKKT